MAVEVVVTISPDMFREDVDLLRSWLTRAFPYDWIETSASGREDSLSAADLVITAALSGVAEAASRAAVHAIRERIEDLAERYPTRRGHLAEVEAKPCDDEVESPQNPPDGNDRESS